VLIAEEYVSLRRLNDTSHLISLAERWGNTQR
jgi:hypothetical protein